MEPLDGLLVAPMLAKAVIGSSETLGLRYEPRWDDLRAIAYVDSADVGPDSCGSRPLRAPPIAADSRLRPIHRSFERWHPDREASSCTVEQLE